LVPRSIRDELCERIAAEADKMNWDYLAQARKTATLSEWAARDDIGGRLGPLLGSDAQVRVWIKDVALKRRSRNRKPTARLVVERALGGEYHPTRGTEGIKPHHCHANGLGETYVCWGPPSQAKHLFWAAMNAVVCEAGLDEACVVLVSPVAGATPGDHRANLERLAQRCGLQLAWMSFP
jgi:hypothetical protein